MKQPNLFVNITKNFPNMVYQENFQHIVGSCIFETGIYASYVSSPPRLDHTFSVFWYIIFSFPMKLFAFSVFINKQSAFYRFLCRRPNLTFVTVFLCLKHHVMKIYCGFITLAASPRSITVHGFSQTAQRDNNTSKALFKCFFKACCADAKARPPLFVASENVLTK